uniref:F-box domain-containing protein n=1 Tax=Caenorhabditis tropicalis TaxID=1561998 RepID=A0A1I7TH80_9PELO
MTTFLLFQLPLVALEHVLYMMNPLELINISSTSTKSKRSVKNLSRIKHKFLLSLGFTANEPFIVFLRPPTRVFRAASWAFTWVSDESKTGYEEDFSNPNNFHTCLDKYSENPVEEIMKCYEYIKEVLGFPIDDVWFELNSFPSQNKQIIDWIRSQQESVPQINIMDTEEGVEDDVKYLLNNSTITRRLEFYIEKYKSGFQMEIPSTPCYFVLKNSSFIDFDQLLTMENENICLSKSILTNKDINEFLESWMARESHLNLKTFEINVSGPEAMDEIMDLSYHIIYGPGLVEMFQGKFDRSKIEDEFYRIERCDGKVAAVGYGRSPLGHRLFMITC